MLRSLIALTVLLAAACSSPASTCRSDVDCTASGRVCDPGLGLCVECVRDADCLGADQFCVGDGTCRDRVACESSRQCPGQLCDLGRGFCVDCIGDEDCPADRACQLSACLLRPPTCGSDAECADQGLVCEEGLGRCVECVVSSDCAEGRRCEEFVCAIGARDGGPPDAGFDGGATDAGSDAGADAGPLDAGRCAAICPTPSNATATCEGDVCGYECRAGFADCDGAAVNGCEIDTLFDANHCSACDVGCSNAAMGTAACIDGECGFDCAPGFGDCDAEPQNGCETALGSDPAFCESCDPCPARDNATPTCDGSCGFQCAAGFENCDGVAANGCEANLSNDPAQCGSCGRECLARPSSSPVCVAGSCDIVCNANRLDCDGQVGNGCEVDRRTNGQHCGACNNVCTPQANATSSCVSATCRLSCQGSNADCDGVYDNGCEVTLSSNVSHCGACNNACPDRPNSSPRCASGCSFTCDAGYRDCDGMASNGCEHMGPSCPS